MTFLDAITRPIPGFPGYRVTYSGVVQSCLKMGRKFEITAKWRNLSSVSDGRSYPKVSLARNGKKETRLVAHLVCEAFHGCRPDGMYCCHCDGNISNSHGWNLRWDTPTGNAADTLKHGNSNRGEAQGRSKLVEAQVREIFDHRRTGATITEIASKFGVNHTSISKILRRKTWSHLELAL